MSENAKTAKSQEEYKKNYAKLINRYQTEIDKLKKLEEEKKLLIQKDKEISAFIRNLKKHKKFLEEWDDSTWNVMVDNAIIHKDKKITFKFKNGAEIKTEA